MTEKHTSEPLEEMSAFFSARLDGYDEHMLTAIEGAGHFYRFTAGLLPVYADASVLDLGIGTGLEFEEYQKINPHAKVTGIDLSEDMLTALKRKLPDAGLNLIRGSYFDVPFGEDCFDAAVSVESLHHFKPEAKLKLYEKLRKSLKNGGYFILTDYFAESEEKEREYFAVLERMKAEQNLPDDRFYHYDTPLTVKHETEVLREAGFSRVEILKNWSATYTVKADK